MAEKFPQLTPYNYAGNKPVTQKDLEGLQGTGDEEVKSEDKKISVIEESQEEWNKHKQDIIDKRDELNNEIERLNLKAENKGWSKKKLKQKLGDIRERVYLLDSTIFTIKKLEESSQVYSLSINKEKEGETTYNDGVINFQFDGTTSNFIHEITHGGQFEKGELMFDKEVGSAVFQDIYDEIDAYRAQYAYDTKSTGGENLLSIDSYWVRTIKNKKGELIYDENISSFPLNVNTTTKQFKKSYPENKKIQSIPRKQDTIP